MALNVPYENSIPTLSLSDSAEKWAGIENQQRQADLNATQEKRIAQQAEQEGKVNEIKFNTLQRAAHNEILTSFKTELQKKAQMAGIQPNTPEYQKLANAIYASRYDKLMQNTGAPAFQPGTDIDLAHVETVMTPDEEHARIMEQEQAKQNAMLGRERTLLDYGNQYKDKVDERNHQQSLDVVDRKHDYDTGDMLLEHKLKIAELESKAVNTPEKPLPPTIVKEQKNLLEQIGIANSISADLSTFKDKIDKGELHLSMLGNAANTARNYIGASTPESTSFASFKSSLEKLRNDSLRLNIGVQTEGDARRAWDEIFQNINDEDVVKSRLNELITINKRAAELKKAEINSMRAEYGRGEVDDSGFNVESAINKSPSKQSYNLSTATQKKPDNVSPEKWHKYMESIGAK